MNNWLSETEHNLKCMNVIPSHIAEMTRMARVLREQRDYILYLERFLMGLTRDDPERQDRRRDGFLSDDAKELLHHLS